MENRSALPSLPVLYEDADFLLVDKPVGLVVEPENFPRLFLVHRLDKETSGVLLLAKNPAMAEKLRRLFKERRVKKEYWALISGHLPHPRLVLQLPLGRHPKTRRRAVVENGREAETEVAVIKKYKDYSLIKVWPKTGRTHQIRLHLSALGTPIVADPFYGPFKARRHQRRLFTRQLLHAKILEFVHPATGKKVKVEASLAPDFARVINELSKT